MRHATGRTPEERIPVPDGGERFIYRLTGILLVLFCLLVIWISDNMGGTFQRIGLTVVAIIVLAAILKITKRGSWNPSRERRHHAS
jgi:hypothetical protein